MLKGRHMNTATLERVNSLPVATSTASPPGPLRQIVARTRGRQHGPINRLVSPSDLGQLMKPFVFLDRFEVPGNTGKLFGMHPHSGIATITVLLSGSSAYEDTTGKSGQIDAGSVEWMSAGGGVWHDARPVGSAPLTGYQLWVALPADLEATPASSQYLPADQVPQVGPARLIFGSYGGQTSLIASPPGMTYLHVRLKDGERWRYEPPAGHDVAWLNVHTGTLQVSGSALNQETAVFDAAETPIDAVAQGDTEFIFGSAVKHPHEMHMGSYSIHTSAAALQQGEAGIARIGMQLRAQGRI
jgi:redox-sensitive bicupin YhaK (pirin superfamily)